MYELFRATAALPGLYNRKVPIDGRRYIDGGVADIVPLEEALASASEAVVLLTRGANHRMSERGAIFRTLVRALSHGQSHRVREKICSTDTNYNAAMDMLAGERQQFPRRTWTLRPSNLDRLVNRTTNNFARLRDCAELGRSDMRGLLSQEHRATAATAQPQGVANSRS
jgi:predicted patatin/cPLA2 family phospholipase